MKKLENMVKRANWTLLAAVVLFIVMSLVVMLLYRGDDLLRTYSLSALLCSIGALYVPALLCIGRRDPACFGKVRIRPGQVVLCVVLGVSVLFLSSGINLIVSYLAESLKLSQSSTVLPDEQGWRVWGSLVTLALIPAVTEEQLFRGLLVSAYRPLGRKAAVLLSSLLFALMHGQPLTLVSIFLLGVVMGELVYESGSMYPSMIVHFVNNAAIVLLRATLSPSAGAGAASQTLGAVEMMSAVVTCIVLGLPAFLACFSRLRASFRVGSSVVQPEDGPTVEIHYKLTRMPGKDAYEPTPKSAWVPLALTFMLLIALNALALL